MVCGFTKQNQKCGYRVLSILRDYKERRQVNYDQSQWAQEECGAVLCPQHRCGRNCFSSGVSPGNLHRPHSVITKDLMLLPIAVPVLPLGIKAEPLACSLVMLCSNEHSLKYVVRCSSKSPSAIRCYSYCPHSSSGFCRVSR